MGNNHRGKESALRIALLVNTAKHAPPAHAQAPEDIHAELDKESNVESYAAALRGRGHEVLIREGDAHLAAWLEDARPDLCFNTCEGFGGDSREAQVPGLLEMIGVPYTGPTPLAAAVTHEKAVCKRVVHTWSVRTPPFQVFESPSDKLHHDLRFPLFVKPLHEGTGMGIKADSIVSNARRLREQVAYVIEAYRQPALVEDFIEGADITCGLIGNDASVHLFPITEVDFSGYPPELGQVYGFDHKVPYDALYKNKCPAPLSDEIANEVRQVTHKVFRVTQCRDFARCDYRLTPDGRLFFLEINALPGIAPNSDLTLMAKAEGWSHAELVTGILDAAVKRYGGAAALKARARRAFEPVLTASS